MPETALRRFTRAVVVLVLLALSACQGQAAPSSSAGVVRVIAVESFLADLAQQVAGDRFTVETLIPLGADPHTFEPTPRDAARLESATLILINGAGFEAWLEKTLASLGGQHPLVSASAGLQSRPTPDGSVDPHFWLDPTLAIHYVENIRDAFTKMDPGGADVFNRNAEAYILQLRDLDGWIQQRIQSIPSARRILVTNHESLGYYADRYGLRILGTVIPGVSTESAPSAQQLARLVDAIRTSGAPAIFLETGASPQLADQVAAETGVKVVTDLYTHSITPPEGLAPSYLAMLRHDTDSLVAALK